MQNAHKHRVEKLFPRVAAVAAVIVLAGLFPGACHCGADASDLCRLEPEHCDDGLAGAFCEDDRDCRGICCTENSNCAGGMCTFPCADDYDCPREMACEHDVCFYLCDSDEDCAVGQSCEHDNTICEWP